MLHVLSFSPKSVQNPHQWTIECYEVLSSNAIWQMLLNWANDIMLCTVCHTRWGI